MKIDKEDVKLPSDRISVSAAGQGTPLDTDGFRLTRTLLSARTRHSHDQEDCKYVGFFGHVSLSI